MTKDYEKIRCRKEAEQKWLEGNEDFFRSFVRDMHRQIKIFKIGFNMGWNAHKNKQHPKIKGEKITVEAAAFFDQMDNFCSGPVCTVCGRVMWEDIETGDSVVCYLCKPKKA